MSTSTSLEPTAGMLETMASVQGKIVPLSQAMVPALDRGYLFADAVYEVLRIYRGRMFLADGHFRRLERSLAAIHIQGVDIKDLWIRIAKMIEEYGFKEGLVYIQISRGVAPRNHAFPENIKPFEFFFVQEFRDYAAALREKGVNVSLQADIRWGRCDIKSTNLLGNILAYQSAKEKGAVEAVLFREDGTVTEMTRTSFFVVRDGVIWTHPESPRILPSITRDLVFRLAEKIAQPIRAQAVKVDQLKDCEEMFMAGTTAEVIPVVSMDGKPVGSGKPGPVTRAMEKAFEEYLKNWLATPGSEQAGEFSD